MPYSVYVLYYVCTEITISPSSKLIVVKNIYSVYVFAKWHIKAIREGTKKLTSEKKKKHTPDNTMEKPKYYTENNNEKNNCNLLI